VDAPAGLLLLLLLLGSVTHRFWTLRIGQNLMCPEEIAPSDIILVENFEPDYLVFKRAAAFQLAGVASRVFVPVPARVILILCDPILCLRALRK
jgi:hypothetical protein